MTSIYNNITNIKKRVEEAAKRSGRSIEDITIIAVTKTVDEARALETLRYGLNDLGENRVQELCKKYDNINISCNWHLIGHLQTNKVRQIIDKAFMIHSVDSMELALEINKRAGMISKKMDILVQVNVSGEASKSGIRPAEIRDFMVKLSPLNNISVKGLMTIAPYVADPNDIRWVFRDLKKIFVDIDKENIDNIHMQFLSMGMSNDFEVAIEEGSNMVRIGTSIFGERHY